MILLETDYSELFYWLVVADQAKTLFLTIAIIFGAVLVISIIFYFCASTTHDGYGNGNQTEDDQENQAMARKWIWWTAPFAILFNLLCVFTPSKRDALLIVAGGQTMNFLTTDKAAKQIPHELSSFLVTEIKNMAKDAEVDLNISSQKDKLLEKAKNMTADQLLKEMKADSTFAKVILEK